MDSFKSPFSAALIIPTGIGASIGGFGGDASGQMNLLAGIADQLITHPNVANAAMFQNKPSNTLYVEGYALDRFFLGEWRLKPCQHKTNKIGVVFDRGIEARMLNLHINTLNAVQTVYNTDFIGYTFTDEAVEAHCGFDPSGSSTGKITNPQTILDACQQLIEQGAEAIALCVQMPELSAEDSKKEENYKNGVGVDPVGGIEALLSHLVVSHFKIPCAHAPVFTEENAALEMDSILDPRTASEYITSTFLPCVLTGLQRAPQYENNKNTENKNTISIHDLNALIVPESALGSIPVLSAIQHQIPIIAVAENETVMQVSSSSIQELAPESKQRILKASSYYEAAGMMQALKQGLPVPFPKGQKVKATETNIKTLPNPAILSS